jgi:Holliday junction resolvasome RuvABC endonuclease subunit
MLGREMLRWQLGSGERRTMLNASRICGLDYSLTNCGIAILDHYTVDYDGDVSEHCTLSLATVRSTGHLTDPLPVRRRRLRTLSAQVVEYAGECDLVIIEGVIPSKGPLLDRYAGMWFIFDRLIDRAVPIAVVSPDSMKSAITGKTARQGADKFMVGNHVRKLWPGVQPLNDNEQDAVGLAHLGAVALGWPVPTLERHKAVKWTEWPEFGPQVVEVAS